MMIITRINKSLYHASKNIEFINFSKKLCLWFETELSGRILLIHKLVWLNLQVLFHPCTNLWLWLWEKGFIDRKEYFFFRLRTSKKSAAFAVRMGENFENLEILQIQNPDNLYFSDLENLDFLWWSLLKSHLIFQVSNSISV